MKWNITFQNLQQTKYYFSNLHQWPGSTMVPTFLEWIFTSLYLPASIIIRKIFRINNHNVEQLLLLQYNACVIHNCYSGTRYIIPKFYHRSIYSHVWQTNIIVIRSTNGEHVKASTIYLRFVSKKLQLFRNYLELSQIFKTIQ